MEDLYTQIEQYSDLVFRADSITAEKQAFIDKILTPEIKAQLADLDAEFEPIFSELDEKKSMLEAQIKTLVSIAGRTIKGTYHQFVWSKPRVSWDTKALDGYALAHPEIVQFRKEGSPSVSVRKA